jgi:hypoxanthine phosphoribosyltransferase
MDESSLIIDDILDTGKTLELIRGLVLSAGAASARTCVLIAKRRDDLPARVAADFVGFDIEDQFVVGYGLDYGDLYRNLPDVCLLRDLAGGNGR